MTKMPIISLPDTAKALGESGGRVNVLWQQPDSLVFMARGREYRSDPVSKAYQTFFDSEDFRTCKKCGTVMPKP